jgi:hypothetical protein
MEKENANINKTQGNIKSIRWTAILVFTIIMCEPTEGLLHTSRSI